MSLSDKTTNKKAENGFTIKGYDSNTTILMKCYLSEKLDLPYKENGQLILKANGDNDFVFSPKGLSINTTQKDLIRAGRCPVSSENSPVRGNAGREKGRNAGKNPAFDFGAEGLAIVAAADHRGRNNPDAPLPWKYDRLNDLIRIIESINVRAIKARYVAQVGKNPTGDQTRSLVYQATGEGHSRGRGHQGQLKGAATPLFFTLKKFNKQLNLK